MIHYIPGVSFRLIFKVTGSVFPIALRWSLPAAFIAGVLNIWGFHSDHTRWLFNVEGMSTMWSSYSFVLGFLIVFRNNQAYSRFWEGAELIHQVRGEWLNAVSSLVAFCNAAEEKADDVLKFQHCIVRLVSMLHCSALQQIAEVDDNHFEIFDPSGIDPKRLIFIKEMSPNERCQVLLQWIQRLIVEADQQGVLKVAPPILSRVYQELSRGIVNLHNVTKIKEVQFPFPYAQMIAVMMMVHWFITPVLASQSIESWFWASFMTFVTMTAFWSLFYIALEIEQPFGEDPNDLPVWELQVELNKSLSLLLQREMATPPEFKFNASFHCDLKREQSNVLGCKPLDPHRPDSAIFGNPLVSLAVLTHLRSSRSGSSLDESDRGSRHEIPQRILTPDAAYLSQGGASPRPAKDPGPAKTVTFPSSNGELVETAPTKTLDDHQRAALNGPAVSPSALNGPQHAGALVSRAEATSPSSALMESKPRKPPVIGSSLLSRKEPPASHVPLSGVEAVAAEVDCDGVCLSGPSAAASPLKDDSGLRSTK